MENIEKQMKSLQYFDTKIIALGLAISSGLIYTRVFENEFFKDIILVAIPSVIGLFGSKWVTNLWQIRSAKINMKKEVLENFQKSSKRIFVLIDTFTLRVADHYADYHNVRELPTTGKIEMNVSVLPDGKEHPSVKFASDYEILQREIDNTRFDSSKFLSSLRLYYNSEDLERKFQDIAHHLKYLSFVVEAFLHSNDATQFKKIGQHYTDKSDEIKKQIKSLEKELINSPLNEPKI